MATGSSEGNDFVGVSVSDLGGVIGFVEETDFSVAIGSSEGNDFVGVSVSDLGEAIGFEEVRDSFAESVSFEGSGFFLERDSVGVNRCAKTSCVSYEPG